jgi:hypothetical protein
VGYDVISQGPTDNYHSDLSFTFSYPPIDVQITRERASLHGLSGGHNCHETIS